MAPGVSSTIISTPVNFSKVLMFRPSLPMIRPFNSSLGKATVEVVTSMDWEAEKRCMASVKMSRAFFSISSFPFCSNFLILSAKTSFSSLSTSAKSSFLASSRKSPATRSNSAIFFVWICSNSSLISFTFFAFCASSSYFLSHSWALDSRDCSRRSNLSSCLMICCSLSLCSRLASSAILIALSLAWIKISLASCFFSSVILAKRASIVPACFLAKVWRVK